MRQNQRQREKRSSSPSSSSSPRRTRVTDTKRQLEGSAQRPPQTRGEAMPDCALRMTPLSRPSHTPCSLSLTFSRGVSAINRERRATHFARSDSCGRIEPKRCSARTRKLGQGREVGSIETAKGKPASPASQNPVARSLVCSTGDPSPPAARLGRSRKQFEGFVPDRDAKRGGVWQGRYRWPSRPAGRPTFLVVIGRQPSGMEVGDGSGDGRSRRRSCVVARYRPPPTRPRHSPPRILWALQGCLARQSVPEARRGWLLPLLRLNINIHIHKRASYFSLPEKRRPPCWIWTLIPGAQMLLRTPRHGGFCSRAKLYSCPS
jgi:hypothetical protein